MDEKIIASKEQKRTSLLLSIALCTLLAVNALLGIFRTKGYSALVPASIALCGVSVVLAIVVLILIIRDYKKLTEKKRSIICCVALFVLCGLEIWLSASTVSDINAKRNAENSAVLFIKEKYGIEAEADYRRTFSSDGRSWTTVDMTADGRKFIVEQLTGTDGNTKLADNYQLDEIKQAVFDEVSRVYSNGTRRDVGIYNTDYLGDPVIERYFDGTNLDELLEDELYHGGVTVDFVDTEFDLDNPLFKKLGEWGIRPYFTSFDTAEHRDEFVAAEQLGHYNDYDKHYAKYAHYITDRVVYVYGESGEKGKVIRKDYDIKSGGEFDYLYVQIEECENGTENLEKFFEKYNESEKVSKPISKAYRNPESIVNSYYIFYPLEKLNGVPAENIGAAWLDNSTGFLNNRGVEPVSVCGEYAVFTLPYRAKEFVIVDTTGTGGSDKEI